MLEGEGKKMMMKGNSAILACSSTSKAALSWKTHLNFPKHWQRQMTAHLRDLKRCEW